MAPEDLEYRLRCVFNGFKYTGGDHFQVLASGMKVVEVELIEINPFFEMTDPCLFDWRGGGDFDRTFRYKSLDKKVISVPL